MSNGSDEQTNKPEHIVICPAPAVLRILAVAPHVSTRPAIPLWKRLVGNAETERAVALQYLSPIHGVSNVVLSTPANLELDPQPLAAPAKSDYVAWLEQQCNDAEITALLKRNAKLERRVHELQLAVALDFEPQPPIDPTEPSVN